MIWGSIYWAEPSVTRFEMSEPGLDIGSARSPCIKACRLDANGCCVGCLRTLAEIAEWSAATNARRLEILRDLKIRTSQSAAVQR